MSKIKATAYILTFNSAATLERALHSVRDFDDVLVCDGGSSDDTVRIAQSFGARVVPQEQSCLAQGRVIDFACVRTHAIAHARYPWILALDSDESASPELVQEIAQLMHEPPAPRAYRMPAGIVLDGTLMRHSSNYPGYQVRFFHRDAGAYQKPIHERFIPHTVPHTLRSPWYYYIDSATARDEYEKDIRRDLPLYVTRYRGASLWGRARGMLLVLKNCAVILVHSLRNRLLYQKGEVYPMRLEWLRVVYQWEVLKTIWRTPSK